MPIEFTDADIQQIMSLLDAKDGALNAEKADSRRQSSAVRPYGGAMLAAKAGENLGLPHNSAKRAAGEMVRDADETENLAQTLASRYGLDRDAADKLSAQLIGNPDLQASVEMTPAPGWGAQKPELPYAHHALQTDGYSSTGQTQVDAEAVYDRRYPDPYADRLTKAAALSQKILGK